MKLLFDARYIAASARKTLPAGGIGRYSYNLLQQLVEIAPHLHLTLLVRESNRRPILPDGDGRVREIKCGNRPSSFRTQFLLAGQIDSGGYDLFHSPFNMLPRGLRCRSVVTIHDIMWLTAPHLCARFLPERLAASFLYRLGIHYALRRADRIITISESAARAIGRYSPQCQKHLSVVHHGLELFFKAIDREEATRQLRALCPISGRFVLMVGQGSPYKNHLRAVQAFMRAFADRPEYKLILVRRFQRFDLEMRRILLRPEVRHRVVLLDSVSEEDLRALYTLAEMFFFPSLEEGFGMPLLEAMACRTPVITADIPVMHEVAGEAALFADPCDIENLAGALSRLADDTHLRQVLIGRGLENIERFSWRRCAQQHLLCYEQITGLPA